MAKNEHKRTTATRKQAATPDLLIDPCWLKVLPTGYRKIAISGGTEAGISAHLRVKADTDIQEMDEIMVTGISYMAYARQPGANVDVWFLQRM